MKHECGCLVDPTDPSDRCDEHREWACHTPETTWATGTCPPCYRARLLTVRLDPRATPTRRTQ